MVELYFLGTGGSVATEERDNTSFLFKLREELILVDCPGSVVQKIKKLGFAPKMVKKIVITHIHPDHVYGLPSLVHSLMLEEGEMMLYGSEKSVDFCKRILDLFQLREKKIKMRVLFHPLKPGREVYLDEGLSLDSFKVPHTESSLALYFCFKEEQKELIYSGDTPLFPPLFDLARGKDFLIHDCSAPSRFFSMYPELYSLHTDSLQLGEFSEKARIKCLIPCHFFGEVEFSLSEIEKEIREKFRGKLIIPVDFQKLVLE